MVFKSWFKLDISSTKGTSPNQGMVELRPEAQKPQSKPILFLLKY